VSVRLLGLWGRISQGGWTIVCYECCVLLGRGLCDELITRPEESYRLWCVVVCDLETSRMKRVVAPKTNKHSLNLHNTSKRKSVILHCDKKHLIS